MEPGVALQLRHVRRGEPLDEVELSRAEVGEAHGGVDDGQIDDAVEMDALLVPVVGEALQHDAILRDALDELERARAHRLGAELVAVGLGGFRRDDHAGAIGELRQQGRERRRQVEAHRQRIDDVDGRHRRELSAAVRPRHRLVPLEAVLDRGGVQLLAVVERDAGTELQRQRLAVRRPFVCGRELRDDRQLLVDVEQLVAHRGEHDAADEGARERGIEHVGVLGEADAQRLRARGGDAACDERKEREASGGARQEACRFHLRSPQMARGARAPP